MRGPSLTRAFESEVNNIFSRNTSKSYSPRMMRILSRVYNLLSPVFSPYYLYLKRDPIHDGDNGPWASDKRSVSDWSSGSSLTLSLADSITLLWSDYTKGPVKYTEMY